MPHIWDPVVFVLDVVVGDSRGFSLVRATNELRLSKGNPEQGRLPDPSVAARALDLVN